MISNKSLIECKDDDVLKKESLINIEELLQRERERCGPLWMIWRRKRYVLAFLVLIGFVVANILRLNISVAIYAMSSEGQDRLLNESTNSMADFNMPVLEAFNYGYVATQLLGGWLSSRFGGHLIFGVGIISTAFFALLSPMAIQVNNYILIVIRFVEGLFEGMTYPAVLSLWTRWSPPNERGRIVGFSIIGYFVGIPISVSLCGIIANYLGWQFIFYITGGCGILWYIIWRSVANMGPEFDPSISKEEKDYILKSTARSIKHNSSPVWMKMVTSVHVWAIVIAEFSATWGCYTLTTQLKSLLRDVFLLDINESGMLSALPFLFLSITILIAGFLGDFLPLFKCLTITKIRKILTCSSFLIQGILLLYLTTVKTTVHFHFCGVAAFSFGGFGLLAYYVNILDLSPNHAGIVLGFVRTIGLLAEKINYMLTEYIVKDHSYSEWKTMLYIASSIYFCGAVFYGIFASSEEELNNNYAKKNAKSSADTENI